MRFNYRGLKRTKDLRPSKKPRHCQNQPVKTLNVEGATWIGEKKVGMA